MRASLCLAMLMMSGAAIAADVPKGAAPPIAILGTDGEKGPSVPDFKIAPGFKVTIAVAEANEVRFMQFDDAGNLYISAPGRGNITSYTRQPDQTYRRNAVVVQGKPSVHGMEFVDGWLWFATSKAVHKGKTRKDGSGLDEVTTVVPEGSVPSGGGHWYRPILVDPDGGFYTGVGDARNFSDLDDPKVLKEEGSHAADREKIWKFAADGQSKTLFASGVRNTEKLQFRPGTHEVWGCDHGSDWWGLLLGDDEHGHMPVTDDIPGDEVNFYEQGKFYGHPYIADHNLVRPEYDKGGPLAKPNIQQLLSIAVPAAYLFPAHWANNGWTFLNKDSGLGHRGDMYVASHGSWNHSNKIGYAICRLNFSPEGKPTRAEEIVNCLQADQAHFLGRPVDVVEEPGTDNVLFSTDVDEKMPSHGHVYRLTPIATK